MDIYTDLQQSDADDKNSISLVAAFPANIQRWGNIVTTLSLVRSDTMLLQRWHNVDDERYNTPQCWYNVVAMVENYIIS